MGFLFYVLENKQNHFSGNKTVAKHLKIMYVKIIHHSLFKYRDHLHSLYYKWTGKLAGSMESLTTRSDYVLEVQKVITLSFLDGEIEPRKRKHIFK